MQANRALEILKSIREKRDIKVSDAEVQELQSRGLILPVQESQYNENVVHELETTKEKYNAVANTLRSMQKDLLLAETEFSKLSSVTKAASHLGAGAGAAIKKQIAILKKNIAAQEKQTNEIRDAMLAMNMEYEKQQLAVKIDGYRVILVPLGAAMIDEIETRPRYATVELAGLLDLTKRLDMQFASILTQIEMSMKVYKKITFWIPYLVNMERIDLAPTFNLALTLGAGGGEEDDEETDVDLFGELLTRSVGLYSAIMQVSSYGMTGSAIYNVLAKKTSIAYDILPVIKFIEAILLREGQVEHQNYLGRLARLLDLSGPSRILAQTPGDQTTYQLAYPKEELAALLLLAFSPQPERFAFFMKKFQSNLKDRPVFAAIGASFPWEPEETWAVLIRAESNILRGQSAKFIPELLEYAFSLSINTGVLATENSIPSAYLEWWRHLVIPAIQAVLAYVVEEDLESFIQARPFSYITAPRVYVRSSFHHHHFGHYHHVG
nr:hypothetical protein [Candidatus Sigynarchaeota archaeon]